MISTCRLVHDTLGHSLRIRSSFLTEPLHSCMIVRLYVPPGFCVLSNIRVVIRLRSLGWHRLLRFTFLFLRFALVLLRLHCCLIYPSHFRRCHRLHLRSSTFTVLLCHRQHSPFLPITTCRPRLQLAKRTTLLHSRRCRNTRTIHGSWNNFFALAVFEWMMMKRILSN